MYLVINKCVTAVKVSDLSGHYLRNRSTLDIGVLGYIGIVQHKEHSPEVLHIPPGTPCTYVPFSSSLLTSLNPVSGKAETEGQAILKIYELLVYGNIHHRIFYSHVIHTQNGLFLCSDMTSKRPDLGCNMLKIHLIWSDRNTNKQASGLCDRASLP